MLRRLSLSVLAIVTVALMVGGATLALFTAQTENVDNQFKSGTVAFNKGVDSIYNYLNMAPGDKSNGHWNIAYRGSLDAWLGLTVEVEGDLFLGEDPDGTPGATIDIYQRNGKVYNINEANQVVAKVKQLDLNQILVDVELPLEAGNYWQDKTGKIHLYAKAVQAKNNTNAAGDGPISWGD